MDVPQEPDPLQGPQARSSPGLRFGLIGLATILIGAGVHLVGSAQREAAVHVVGANLPVNEGATDPLDLTGNNSPSLVRNPVRPENLAIASRIDEPLFSCSLHVSLDGGASWTASVVPFPEGEEAPPRCYAADAGFGADGILYLSFVTLAGLGNVPNAVWMASSSDGGRTVGAPIRVSGPLAFQVRLLVDPRIPGRLHLSWLQASDVGLYSFPSVGAPVVVSTSDDGGRTWSETARASSGARSRVVAPAGSVSGDGNLLVAYLDLGDDALDYHGAHTGRGGEPYPGTWSLVLARSEDGRRWEETVVDAGLVPTERFIVFLPPFPSVVVDDRSGLVHVGFHDGRSGDADVRVWTSRDGGRTFGRSRRVNDTRLGDGTAQYLPKLAVAPNGRLDVLYYDRRGDSDNVMNEVSLQSSSDGGTTFGDRIRISDRAFDSRIGFGRERGLPDLGNRLGLVSGDRRALAVWTDTRASSPDSAEQDLARAVVAFEEASPLRSPLRLTGAGLVAFGLLLGGWVVVRHIRRSL